MMKKNNNKIKASRSSVITTWILRTFLMIWAVVIIFPLFWMLYTSAKERSEFIADRLA